jgi:ATP-binding cassette subfamily F protein uup
MQQREQSKKLVRQPEPTTAATPPQQTAKKKLSYLEAREWATLEDRIAEAEDALNKARGTLGNPSVATDAARLQSALAEAEAAQQTVDTLFTRWAELEAKQAQ